MRNRIRRLALGQFEYVKPEVEFSVEEISLRVTEDGEAAGSFDMVCTNEQKLRGLIYSTNERMECLTPQFSGEQVCIRYCFHAKGLSEGEHATGEFVIVCNSCEYSLSFDVLVTKSYPESSVGRICNMQDFTMLARENWEEAYRLFYHKGFAKLLKHSSEEERLIYRGMVDAHPSNRNLEEFLIAIHRKDPIRISVDEQELVFTGGESEEQQVPHLHKNGWGYLSIHAASDAPFVRLERTVVHTADFLGSGCNLPYVIDPAYLHDGNNYARITLETPYEKLTVSCTVHNRMGHAPSQALRKGKEYKVALVQLYEAWRLGRMVTGAWVNETVDILKSLSASDPDEPLYLLMRAHAYQIGGLNQEAEWILDDFKRSWHDHRSEEWGYYLYLRSLREREPGLVDRMTREIEIIFRSNPESVLLFWVLSFLEDEYYNNTQEKLRAIGHWIEGGCTSPYLYIEAYDLISQEPYLLRSFGVFERRILAWMRKLCCLTPEIAGQIFTVARAARQFDPLIYRVICAAYDVDPKPEYVGVICAYLIRGQKNETKYHRWYALGVELELKITGLYEAYLLSLDEREITRVPQMIQMYFQYRSNLPYKSLAVLFNNIIATRQESPDIYAKYVKPIGRFAMEQAQLGHMDDNLAVVYENMLEMGIIDHDIASSLSKILFTKKLYVFDSHIVRACICHRQMKNIEVVSVNDHVAYFPDWSKDYVILLEDGYGHRFVSSIAYTKQDLMHADAYLEQCMELAPDEIPYMIAWFEQNPKNGSLLTGDVDRTERFYQRLLNADEISMEYKAQLVSNVLPCLKEYANGEGLLAAFIRQVDISWLEPEYRRSLLNLMVENHLYENAYELVREYGADQLKPASQMALADVMVARQGDSEDEFLTTLAYEAFLSYRRERKEAETAGYEQLSFAGIEQSKRDKKGKQGKHGKKNTYFTVTLGVLQYLADHYTGPTDRMFDLWRVADAYGAKTYELEEQILSQMLYADRMLPDIEPLFAKYYQNGGKELVVMAYLTLRSHCYFIDTAPGQLLVFDILESRYLYHMQLNATCKLALMKHLALRKTRSRVQEQALDELLAEFTRQNMYFAFYRNLDETLIQKYHLYDKIILEYRTKPGSHVMLHYCRDEDEDTYIAEEMVHVYDGIYVKLFVMFFGEMTRYYISEEDGNQMRVTESSRLMGQCSYSDKEGGRYDRMNQMLGSAALMERQELQDAMEKYQELDEVTRNSFLCI